MRKERKGKITSFNLTYMYTNKDLDITSSFPGPDLPDLRNTIKYDIVHQRTKLKLFPNTISMQFKNFMPFYAALQHQLWKCYLWHWIV